MSKKTHPEIKMPGPALIINTHPEPNPGFTAPLVELVQELGAAHRLVSGYRYQPLDRTPRQPSCVLLTGVPLEADYSLTEPETQMLISKHLGWLQEYQGPVLGICYGHQILAHLLGGTIAALPEPVQNPQLEILLTGSPDTGLFQGFYRLEVFAEHRDYVSIVPKPLQVLSARDEVPYLVRHPGREWYGCQFVPERSGPHTRSILKRFLMTYAARTG
jgi:GMP synthase-like glutamine amidotransferase